MKKNTSNSGQQHLSKDALMAQLNFFKIYNFMILCLGLTGLALNIYAKIFSFWLHDGDLFASNETLAAQLKCTRESVNRKLRYLVSEKLVTKLPHRGKQGVCVYTINDQTLCDKITGWSDLKSQLCVTIDHTEMCDNITSWYDETSHQYKIVKDKDSIGDSAACPLPAHVAEDKVCCELWATIQAFPDWRVRPIGAKAAALQILEGRDVVVCREMLRNTASRMLSTIYPPDPWMLKMAPTQCDVKSHQSRPQDKRDDVVISSLASCFPAELKDDIYDGGLPGQRGLRFRDDNGKVVITCSPPVRDWLTAIQSDLEPVLRKWVGPNYAGFEFNIPNL